MKIVIDIDNDLYNFVVDKKLMVMDLPEIEQAIRHGTVLPKGRGDLISRNALKEKIDTFCEIGKPCSFKSQSACKKCFVTDFRNEIDNAPTVINADSEVD